ncbi:translocation/assembly module TamB domain-containing protein [Ferruginibacter sp.]
MTNFLGTAKVYSATLLHNNTKLSFDSLTLNSFIADGKKHLSILSNEVEGSITGDFKILELPDAFKVFLSRYYPAYIPKPNHAVSNQDFSFFIKTKEVDEYVQLIDPRLKGFNDATFSGNLRLAQNELNVKAFIPQFEYDKKVFNSVNLESKGNLDTLFTRITAGDVVLNDSLHFPGTDLSIRSNNDVSVIQLKTSASKTLSEAELNATVQTLSDGVRIHFSPSSFIVNDKKWQLEKDGELTIRKSYIDASEVKFVQGNQEIVLSTRPAEDGTDHTDVVAQLKKVNIDDFAPFFLKKPRIEGVITGTVTLSDPFGKQRIDYEAEAENLTIDDKKIGDTKLNGGVNTATGLVTFKTKTDNPLYKVDIDGSYNYKDSTDKQMNIDVVSEHFDISLLDNYLGSIFSHMHGDAVSNLKISGGPNNKNFTGSVSVTGGSLMVNYTQCKYWFDNETFILNPGELDLGEIALKDTFNNEGTASGKVYFKNMFDELSFDNVNFHTKRNMLLLNTTEKDNSQFYGRVLGSATMSLNGPVTDMKMKINGSTSTTDSSHISIPTGSGREASAIDYIDFVQFGTEMQDGGGKKESSITLDMDLKANPACRIDVILDDVTGDVIRGQGNGDLSIHVGSNEKLEMRGRYDITKGEYKFNFQTFLQKYFTVNSGSSIVWTGDPYLANINIEAEYLAKNVDLSSISSSNNFKQKGDIKILASLTGILNKPDIKFSFVIPDRNNPLYGDFFAMNKLEAFRKEESEMNKQVASLLLINSFISTGQQNALTGNVPFTLAANTIGGVVSGWLTGIFNKSLDKATGGKVSTYLDINSSFDLQSTAALLQANVRTGFQFLLNNRLVILIGGNIDFNNPYALITNKNLISPDITIEYMLTKDGRWRAVGFNRTSIVATDLTGLQRNKTGLKISYRRDYDKRTKEEKIRRRERKNH